jgi:hypothetical protein
LGVKPAVHNIVVGKAVKVVFEHAGE